MNTVYISHFFSSCLYQKKIAGIAARGVNVTGISPPCWIDEGRKQCFEPGPSGNVISIPAYFIGSGSLYFFKPLALARALRRLNADVIHIDEEPWSLACLEVLILRWLLFRRSTLLFDSSENLDKAIPFPFSAVERLMFACASAATAISEEVKARLKKRGFRKPVEVVGHGVDLQDYPTYGKGPARREQRLDDAFTIGYVGIVARRKGVFVLLEAFRQAHLPAARLVFVGSGEALEELKVAAASDVFLSSRVRFLDPVPHSGIPRLLPALDVLVLPSLTTPRWKEQFGRILIEAMASRVALIGSDSGGIPGVLGDAGIVVPEGDAGALAAVLGRLATDEAELQRLSERSLERVQRHFTWSAVSRQVTELYESCVPKGGPVCKEGIAGAR